MEMVLLGDSLAAQTIWVHVTSIYHFLTLAALLVALLAARDRTIGITVAVASAYLGWTLLMVEVSLLGAIQATGAYNVAQARRKTGHGRAMACRSY